MIPFIREFLFVREMFFSVIPTNAERVVTALLTTKSYLPVSFSTLFLIVMTFFKPREEATDDTTIVFFRPNQEEKIETRGTL